MKKIIINREEIDCFKSLGHKYIFALLKFPIELDDINACGFMNIIDREMMMGVDDIDPHDPRFTSEIHIVNCYLSAKNEILKVKDISEDIKKDALSELKACYKKVLKRHRYKNKLKGDV